MNIQNLVLKLNHIIENIDFNEESLNYPVLKFKIRDMEFNFFYRENFIKRTKFLKKYNTFLEITANDKSELLIFKNDIEKMFSCKYCIDQNKIYLNISKVEDYKIIDFIIKINNNSFTQNKSSL